MMAQGHLRRFWDEFAENRIAVAALVVVLTLVALALLAPLIAPQNPYDLSSLVLSDSRRPPGFVGSKGFTHWLGTDAQGRDLLSAILYGLKISLQIGLSAGAIAFSVGVSLGAGAAFIGGRFEAIAMRIVDLQLSFPAILLARVISALTGQGKLQLIVALAAAQYAYFARTAHGAAVVAGGFDNGHHLRIAGEPLIDGGQLTLRDEISQHGGFAVRRWGTNGGRRLGGRRRCGRGRCCAVRGRLTAGTTGDRYDAGSGEGREPQKFTS
jgi:hypothetical protein